MKKDRILFLSLIALFSCGNKIPKDINDFLIKAVSLKEEDVKEGHFSQELNETIDGQEGNETIIFAFSRNSDEDFNFKATSNFSGTRVKEGVTSKVVELKYISQDNYQFDVTTNEIKDSKTINYQEAHRYYYRIFDNGANPYRFGGLYYGEFMSVKANQFYKKYSLNETKDQLTYEENDVLYVLENKLLDQKIVIDQYGMLLSMEQFVRDKDNESNQARNLQIANYKYVSQ